jgi:alkanesulfonate monooxygenase
MSDSLTKFPDSTIELFSTCPQGSKCVGEDYLRRVIDAARWSEETGCTGILIYTDHSELDPWLVAQVILENTTRLCPLVAVQPAYMHPFAVAKMVSSLAFLYGRRVYLNMVAGGFKNDLHAMNDQTSHDQRYERLIEYASIILQLLGDSTPQNYAGKHYEIKNLTLSPPLPAQLMPELFVSGSSSAGIAAARHLGGRIVQYPVPGAPFPPPDLRAGWRVGMIARPTTEQAWEVAHTRFPEDRRGKFLHKMAMNVSDSSWHVQLSATPVAAQSDDFPYWLSPFQNYQSMCPYLVGDHSYVADEIGRCVAKGFRTFIVDIPASREDLEHISAAFKRVKAVQKEIAL